MPLYEYECKSCGHIFEKLESINTEERTASCPECSAAAERKVSLTSYHLKGGGFYNTDKQKPVSSCAEKGCASAGACPMSKE